MAAACARRRGRVGFALLRGEHGELLVERLAAAARTAGRVRGADERLELVAAGAAGVLEDRHQPILPVGWPTQLPNLSRMSSGNGTAVLAAVSKHTSTAFCVAQCVIESASYRRISWAKLLVPTRVSAPRMRISWPARISWWKSMVSVAVTVPRPRARIASSDSPAMRGKCHAASSKQAA